MSLLVALTVVVSLIHCPSSHMHYKLVISQSNRATESVHSPSRLSPCEVRGLSSSSLPPDGVSPFLRFHRSSRFYAQAD